MMKTITHTLCLSTRQSVKEDFDHAHNLPKLSHQGEKKLKLKKRSILPTWKKIQMKKKDCTEKKYEEIHEEILSRLNALMNAI